MPTPINYEKELEKIIESSGGCYIDYYDPWQKTILIDGELTKEELEKIVEIMKKTEETLGI